jgi:acyl-CoA thioesterase
MHKFDEDIALSQHGPSLFKGKVTDGWAINSVPNGGYILAILANAMLNVSKKNSTPILTANYISRCASGDADLLVEIFSESSQFTRLQASLSQNGAEKVRAIGTFAEKKDTCFIERLESAAPEIAPLEKCLQVPALQNYTLMDRIDVRIDPACAEWMLGQPGEKSEQKGWIKFQDDRHYDIPAIALISDSFPPAILASQGIISWVPTIEFSVNIRNIPTTKWLKGIFRTKYINCGLLEEDGEIWDENGGLVAISRQIAQFRTGGK